MALSGLELHHHAIRMPPDTVDATLQFYGDVLGLSPDTGGRAIPDVPLLWMDAANGTQIHLFGVEGVSRYARRPDRDPFSAHVAFGVPDIDEATRELDRLDVRYWRIGRGEARQLFLHDPGGNMIELHQIGACRCDRRSEARGGDGVR